MNLKELQKNWDALGAQDPYWGVLSDPDKKGGRWDKAEFFATGEAEVDAMLARCKALGLRVKPGSALDFGCALGRLTQALGRRFSKAVGVDIAPSMLAQAEALNRLGKKVSYRLNERPDLSQFKDRSFDLVYSSLVLQHMRPEYAAAYIAEFSRLLKPGGVAVFQVPQTAQDQAWRRALKRLTPQAVLRLYRRLRYGAGHAAAVEVEMHGLGSGRVKAAVEQGGAELRAQEGDRYFVLKPAVSEGPKGRRTDKPKKEGAVAATRPVGRSADRTRKQKKRKTIKTFQTHAVSGVWKG